MGKLTVADIDARPACSDCGCHHLGPACGMTELERLGSVDIHGTVLETRTKKNHYDRAAIVDQFGPDARERMMEDTHGIGAVKLTKDGRPMHKDRKSGDVVPLTEKELQTMTPQPGWAPTGGA